MMYERGSLGYDPIITFYTAKDDPTAVALNINANNSLYQGNCQSTDMNYYNMVDSGNKTEILCKRVTLLLKVTASNNT